ncbi:ExbD/TolR family protein [Granulosicoccus antarcticus]|uniref:Biopolymer transport protein ExbD n=1 Tax=Granulosicoccus antarcticus IMCC3135 TaxID=1192854 RepID=A0A2Z2NP79_9GAMM|nr:biopolymer transporter ExbD [Granulosicoccus antarcticus]ASJ73236.1 hypothetical protein IMCC3135_15770 [Granulosicoccus antarcticus IMCC3135]
MIFRDEAPRKTPQLDLTPLINVVFLLLVFFMLTGSLTPADSLESAKVDSQNPVEEGLLIVSVNQAGVAMINAELLTDEALIKQLALYAQTGGKVGIKPDARLDAQRLVQLTALLRQAGFDSMTLITQQR